MNIALWIAQIILGLAFIMAGIMKALQYEKAKASMPWVRDQSKGFVRFIGIVELLGGLGLIIPILTGIAPVLTTVAAIGLALIMLFAAIFHASRKENQAIGINVIMLLIAAFVAYGRIIE
jgi:uncharacterized membrane protein YphA (DoxX/SURF4 family)